MKDFKALEKIIEEAYEGGVTMEQAERHAARFLAAQIGLSEQLLTADLDARMRKTGLKAVKAAVYLENATKGEKKPSDVLLQAVVDTDGAVSGEQEDFDRAEASKDNLERLYGICREAHVYFRGIAKGSFNG